jgi:hypothetical protein
MQMYKFFDLQTPRDLLRKLEREYDRWKADPWSVDLAWNFFVTAEHLPDWIYYQDMPTSGMKRPDLLGGKKLRDFKHAQFETRICSHLANGGKHFHLDDPNLNSVAATRREGAWGSSPYGTEAWGGGPTLIIDLTPDEQATRCDALTLAAQVLAFWQRRLGKGSGP